jgi:magnesium transporter
VSAIGVAIAREPAPKPQAVDKPLDRRRRFRRLRRAKSGTVTLARWATNGNVKGTADVDVRLLGPAGVTEHLVDELPSLLARDDGLVWVDIPSWDDGAAKVLAEVFTFHPLAIRDCGQRNQVPKVHVYGDHVFVVLHAPHAGAAGHVHYVELDQFIGPRYLVTVHGPLNPAVDPAAAMVEVTAVMNRLESGRLRPTQGYELSHALVSALTGRLRDYTAVLTQDVWKLEQRVTAGHLGDAEQFLDEMFRARHGLLTVKTMAALSREVYARMAKIRVFGTDAGQARVEDTVDQFDRLRAMADGQKDYLQGTIEFYQARTNTKMTVAAERLAVIAAVTLPVTAVSSILGMNVIVNEATQPLALAIALLVMATISVTLLVWAKRKGWW